MGIRKRMHFLVVFFASFFIAGAALADLGVSVTLAENEPTDIFPSESTIIEITLSNNNIAADINTVAFSNSLPGVLPDGLSISGGAGYTCFDPSDSSTNAGLGTLTAVSGDQAISLSNGVIPARANNMDGTCTITIPVTAGSSNGAAAGYTYTIADSAVTGNDGTALANSGAVSQSINVTQLSLPVITKAFGDDLLFLSGAPTTLTISVQNPLSNSISLTGIGVTDNFPFDTSNIDAVIQVAAAPSATSSCSDAGTPFTFTPSATDIVLSATNATIQAGETCTITVQVEARQTGGEFDTDGPGVDDVLENIIVGATDFASDIGLEPLNASAEITARSPLGVTKSFSSSVLSSGETGSFTIGFSNSGTGPITVNSFTDSPIDGVGDLSTGLKLSGTPVMVCSGTGSAGTLSNTANDVGFTLSSDAIIEAGGTCTITGDFIGTVSNDNTASSYTNTIAEGDVGTTNPGIINQARSATIIISDTLRILKSSTPTRVAPGNPISYTITVQNWSTSVLSNIAIVDALTNGQTFLDGTSNSSYLPVLSGTGCTGLTTSSATGDSSADFTFTSVPARSSATSPGSCAVTFFAMTDISAAENALISNSLGAGSVCFNNNPGVDADMCNGTGASAPNRRSDAGVLEIDKTFSPEGPVSENTIVTMTIEFTNLSATDFTSAVISDNLPAASGGGQMRIADVPNAATTCSGGTITAAAGTTSLSLNDATIPARENDGFGDAGTCFVQVDVTAPAGVYNNTATVLANGTYADGTPYSSGELTDVEPITFNSSLSTAKSFTPTSVSEGGMSTVIVRLNNIGPLPITGISVTDPLPVGMVLANPVNASTTCAGSTSFTAVAGDGSINMSGADIAGNGSCDMLFDVVATGGADWENIIPVGNITADGGIQNQSPISATLINQAPQSVSVSKTTSPSTLTFPGEVSEMTITLTNGTTPVTNLGVNDFFTIDGILGSADNGMVVAANPLVSTTCPGGLTSVTPGGNFASISGISLDASADCQFKLNVTSTEIGGITNIIPAETVFNDQGLSNVSQATTSLTTQANVGITKQFTPNVIAPGGRSRLRITFFNPTSQSAANLAVTDNLPAGVVVAVGPNPTTTCAGATITSPSSDVVQVSGANMPAASGGAVESCFSEIDVTAAAEGDFENIIPSGSVTGDVGGIAVTNSDPTSDILRVKDSLVINKAFDSRTLDSGNPAGLTTGSATRRVGEPSVLSIVLTNPNSDDVTQVILQDILPTSVAVAQTPNASTTCAGGAITASPSSTSIRLTGATVPASGSCTVSVDVLSNISNTYTNNIPAGALSSFEGVTNNEPTNAQLVVSTPPTVAKQFSPPVIGSGGISTVTIFLGNDNDATATLTSAFTDNLPTAPGAVTIAGTPNVVKTCPGSVVANAGASAIAYTNGGTIPAGGCSISFDVTASVAGDYINNIPAGALETDLGDNQEAANAPLSVSTLGYITGKVFRDNNTSPDGIFDVGTDSPIAGDSIELRSGATCAGGLLQTVATDSAGNYLFSELAAGTYSVCQPAQPSGSLNGTTTEGVIISANGSTGSAGSASNPTETSSQIVSIVLNGDGSSGEVSGTTGNNFAEIVGSTISGTVFLDDNNNGVQNGSDVGIVGVIIQLLDNGGTIIQTTTTDSEGNYTFTGLVPDTYSIRQPNQPVNTSNGITVAGTVGNGGTAGTATTPVNLPSQITGIILPPNTDAIGNDFAELANSRTVSGTVFLDYGNDGLFNNADYGLEGITLSLTGTDGSGNPVSDSAITDASGNYSFTDLPDGTYTIVQATQPANTTNGMTAAGSTGGTASNPTATSSQILNVDLMGTNILSSGNNFPEVPGDAPDLTIAKSHAPASFGENSNTGVFTITPSNVGAIDTSGTITIVDTLPVGMTVASPATGAGWSCVGAINATTVTCTTNDVIASATTGNAISLMVNVADETSGQLLVNTVEISGGGEPVEFDGNNIATDTVAISDSARVSGTVWEDTNHDRVLDAGEVRKAGWTVELLLNGSIVGTSTSAADGTYSFDGISPGAGYQLQFRDPVNGVIFGNAVTNERGIAITNGVRDTGGTQANTAGTNSGNPAGADLSSGDGTLPSLTLLAGDNIIEQSLPLDPAGVVYDAITRLPVAGAEVTITGPVGFDPTTDLVGGSDTFVTGPDGMYQFLLTASAPVGDYTLEITTYPGGYREIPSLLIPACTNIVDVSPTPDPALIHIAETAPTLAAPIHNPATCPTATSVLNAGNQASTQHYFTFTIDVSTAADVVNNHIPIDPIVDGDILVIKTSPLVNVNIGSLVPYTITFENTTGAAFTDVDLVDQLPGGFKYVENSATLDGVALEPTLTGLRAVWAGQTLPATTTRTIKLLLVVGSAVQPGEFTNRASVEGSGLLISNIATATVRVTPDPIFDCSEIIGKVFDDANTNGYQDDGEEGLGSVKLATVNGLIVTTDEFGRFHIACAVVPDAERGSNFLMKVDERTLPTGYRITTENPRSVRATKGKMTKINFGAAIHKVIRIDMSGVAFVEGSDELKQEWQDQLQTLSSYMDKASAVIRISYEASASEDQKLAKQRLKSASKLMQEIAEDNACCHDLQIEQELIVKGGAK